MRRLSKLLLMLYAFHLCYCRDYHNYFKEPDKIYLFSSDNEVHKKINDAFSNRVKDIMNVAVEPHNAEKPFPEELDSTSSEMIAIHLDPKGFYQHNYHNVTKRKFRFAGDFQWRICQNQNEEVLDGCEYVIQNHTKLVSESVDSYPRLLNFVTNFDYHQHNYIDECTEVSEPMVIVKCDKNTDPSHETIMQKTIRIDTTPSCEKYAFHSGEKIIAVLAPHPFHLDNKLDLLTIFYDQLEMDADLHTKDVFTNGISLVKTEKMPDAYLEVLQMMNWDRVAIISDDSLISKEFAENMTTLFDANDIVYSSETCEYQPCDFYDVLRPLMMVQPKIVIANVAKENAHTFAEAAARWKQSLVLLVRDWSKKEAQYAAKLLGNVISITLGLARDPYEHKSRNLNILMSTIYEGNWLNNANSLKGTQADLLNMIQYKQNYINAYVNWYWIDNKNNNRRAATTIDMWHHKHGLGRWDRATPQINMENDCVIKSNAYFHPCNDIEFMLLMLVLSVFALSVLGIIYFYEMPAKPDAPRTQPRVREYVRMSP